MAVFRDVKIEWQGKTYEVTPSNRLLRRIEREVPIASYLARASRDTLVSETAFILAEFIRSAGGSADEDEIYEGLMQDLYENGLKASYFKIAIDIADAIVPPGAVKNLPAPEGAPGQDETTPTE